MSWEDIDFELITKGMITKGPSKVSFADYLNTFAWALDERLNMLIETPDGQYPTLPNIYFEVDEIRTQNQDHESDFWVKLKSMVQEYYSLWTSRTWYSVELMTDPVNHEDYLLEDADLIAIITQETFDIISDVQNKFTREYFTADVINALYEIYKLTQYTRVGAGVEKFGVFNPPWGASTINGQENKGRASGGSDSNDDYASFGAANGQAYGAYSTDYGTAGPNGGSRIANITTQTTRTPSGPGGNDKWSVGYSQVINGVSLHSRYRDLNDVLLDMEVTTYINVERNWKLYQFPYFTGDGIPYGPYNDNFDQITVDNPPIEYNATPLFLGTNHQEITGTVNTWAANGGVYKNPALPKQISVFTPNRPEGESYEDNQFFNVSLRANIATNINNAGLEFFIP